MINHINKTYLEEYSQYINVIIFENKINLQVLNNLLKTKQKKYLISINIID